MAVNTPELTIDEIFQKHIPSEWKDFEPREAQVLLSKKIRDAIEKEVHLLAEAGTGVGKSLAYLIPCVLHSLRTEKPVIISTETKALQDQLIRKDIPLLRKILDIPIKAEIAMGASNYLCKRKFHLMRESGEIPLDLATQLTDFENWVKDTETGNRIDYSGVLSSDTWFQLGREVDNCLGKFCPNFSTSFYFKAKESWRTAHIVIANHALLSYHIIGGYNLLPEFEVLVIDEAHNFPDILSQSMRSSLSYEYINNLLSSIHTERKSCLAKDLGYPDKLVNLTKEAIILNENLFGRLPEEIFSLREKERITKKLKLDGGKLESQLEKIFEELSGDSLKYSKESENLAERNIAQKLEMLTGRLKFCKDFLEELRVRKQQNLIFWTEPPDEKKRESYLKLFSEPINAEDFIREYIGSHYKTVVYTSATLSHTKNDFRYFLEQLGYEPGIQVQFHSPFDYPNHCLLYIPPGIPDPKDYEESYLDAIHIQIRELVRLTEGNCFVLFTSNKALNIIKKKLERDLPYPLFSQAELGAKLAKEEFLNTSNSVLLGVNSFWQGVDIRGSKLQNVIITKLPFQVPTDPVLLTKTELMKRNNRDPFLEFQLPRACLLLKQGFGRLIRSHTDTGIVSVLDPRILTKSYGKEFLKVFPEKIPILQDMEELKACYKKLPKYTV